MAAVETGCPAYSVDDDGSCSWSESSPEESGPGLAWFEESPFDR